MPCDQIARERASRIGMMLPMGLTEKEVQKALNVLTHEQAHERLESMSDDEFREFVLILLANRRKKLASVAHTSSSVMAYA